LSKIFLLVTFLTNLSLFCHFYRLYDPKNHLQKLKDFQKFRFFSFLTSKMTSKMTSGNSHF